jgi:hypothetical protein
VASLSEAEQAQIFAGAARQTYKLT